MEINEKYDSILNLFITSDLITTGELKVLGYDAKAINKLIEEGLVTRKKIGYYELANFETLFHYGKRLIVMKEHEKANQIFKKIYSINPNHSGVCYQLFIRCLDKQNYENAFTYFDVFYQTDNPYYQIDSNLILFLLNFITEIPDKYRMNAKFLTLEDLEVKKDDKRYQDHNIHNQIRALIFQRQFSAARNRLEQLCAMHHRSTVQEILMKKLLHLANQVFINHQRLLMECQGNKDYLKMKEWFETRNYTLRSFDEYCLKLIIALMEIMEHGVIPIPKYTNTNDIFVAIGNKNYELALELCIKFNNSRNINNNTNLLYLMLTDIVSQINSLKNTNNLVVSDIKETPVTSIPTISIIKNKERGVITYEMLIASLLSKNFALFISELKQFLSSLGKERYYFVIINLTKISLYEDDLAFVRPLSYIATICHEEYQFDIAFFLQEFYSCLSSKKIEEAKLYLDILEKGKMLGLECKIIDTLQNIIRTSEKALTSKTIRPSSITDFENSVTLGNKIVPVSQTSINKQPTNQVEMAIKEIRSNRRVKLLPKTSSEIWEMAMIGARNDDSIRCYELLIEGNPYVMLKYHDSSLGEKDRNDLIIKNDQLFKSGNYRETINHSFQIIVSSETLKSSDYYMVGCCYLRLHQRDLALKYFLIAQTLNEKENRNNDLTGVIDSLRNPFFMYQKILADNPTTIPGEHVPNLESIKNLYYDQGYKFEDACREYGITDFNRMASVAMSCAYDFYLSGQQEICDEILAYVYRNLDNLDGNTKKTANTIRVRQREAKQTLKF